MKGQPLEQSRWQTLVLARPIVVDPLIERDDAEARRPHLGQPVTGQRHLAGVECCAQPGGSGLAHPLSHCQHQQSAVGLDHQAGLGNRTAGLKRSGQIESANQAVVAHMQRHATHRRVGRQQRSQQRDPALAHRAMLGNQRHAAESDRVDRDQCRGAQGIGPAQHTGFIAAVGRVLEQFGRQHR